MVEEHAGVEYHAEAAQEFEEAAAWYELHHEGLGERSYSAVLDIEDRIAHRPHLGAPLIGRDVPVGVRRHPVPGFPFLVVYITDPRLVVVAVAHTRRKPGYWRDRV